MLKQAKSIKPKGDSITPKECAADETLPCPQISWSGEPLANFPITFSAQTPKQKVCFLTADPSDLIKVIQQESVTYPADFPTGTTDTDGDGLPDLLSSKRSEYQLATAARHLRGPAASAAAGGVTCVDGSMLKPKIPEPKPWQWDFGDGVKVPAGSLGSSSGTPDVIAHTYKKAGTYKVSLTSKITFNVLAPQVQKGAITRGAQSFFKTVYLKQTIQITVQETFCGTLKLHGVPVTTGNGCFIRVSPNGSSDPLYRAFAGDHLELNGGIAVDEGVNPTSPQPSGEALVSPKQAQIFALGGLLNAQLRYASEGNSSKSIPLLTPPSCPGCTPAGDLLAIAVPQPVYNADLDRKVAESPTLFPYSPSGGLGGLPVVGGQIWLSADQPALADLNLKLPPVFTGTAKAKLGAIQSASANGDDVDFSAELPSVKVGPFETDGVVINHRKLSAGGGWYGGGSIGLFGFELAAPYIAPGSSSVKCAKGGPSGFSLTENGGFDFAGASLKPPSDLHPIDPFDLLGFSCLQVAGTQQPFTLQGKVGMRLPHDTDTIKLDGCFLIAILDSGESASGCGKNGYVANHGDETWLRSSANVSLFDTLELASAHFDLHQGAGVSSIEVGGEAHPVFGIWYADFSVEGS